MNWEWRLLLPLIRHYDTLRQSNEFIKKARKALDDLEDHMSHADVPDAFWHGHQDSSNPRRCLALRIAGITLGLPDRLMARNRKASLGCEIAGMAA